MKRHRKEVTKSWNQAAEEAFSSLRVGERKQDVKLYVGVL